jgi:hypothetical protein
MAIICFALVKIPRRLPERISAVLTLFSSSVRFQQQQKKLSKQRMSPKTTCILSLNPPLLAARDEFEFGRIQLHRRVSRVDVIPYSLLQGEFIGWNFIFVINPFEFLIYKKIFQ